MATLKDMAQSILDEKEQKLTPENIKVNETVFGVTGTYTGNGISPMSVDNNMLKQLFRYGNNMMFLDVVKNSIVANKMNYISLYYTFADNNVITQAQIEDFLETVSPHQLSYTFNNLGSQVTSLNLNGFKPSTAYVSSFNFQGAFYDCKYLVDIDISEWNLSALNFIGYNFKGCTSLSTQSLENICTAYTTAINVPNMERDLSWAGFNATQIATIKTLPVWSELESLGWVDGL